jgi:hypothetical protein
MTDPKLAVATERGRYYKDPGGGPDLISVTNVIDACVNKPVLVPWAAKVTAEYVMANLPTIVRRSLREKDQVIKEIKAQVRYVKETAADLGSRIHAHAEAMVIGKPMPADEEVAPYARQLVTWFQRWGVDFERDIEAAECSVAHRALGYAGTADLLVWLRTGPRGARQLWLIDYKTSATRPATSIYPEYRLQLAALRHAEVLWLPDDSDAAMPRIERTGVLNLRQKSHALMPVPAGEPEFEAFAAAVRSALWLKDAASFKAEALKAPAVITATTKGAA